MRTVGYGVSFHSRSQIKVLEEANPIVAAASGAGTENALAFLGQVFGSPSGVHMPVPGLPQFAAVPQAGSAIPCAASTGEHDISALVARDTSCVPSCESSRSVRILERNPVCDESQIVSSLPAVL